MKQWMLIGTAGMALTCMTLAAQGEAPQRSVESFKTARDAAVGRVGSDKRAEVLAQLRAKIASGEVDVRTVLFMMDENLLPGSGAAVNLSRVGAPTEGVLAPPNIIYFDPFETYTFTDFTNPPTSLISLLGQINPAGETYDNVDPELGVADNAVMTSGFGQGAPNPAVNQGMGFGIDNSPPFLALARGSGLDAPNAGFTLGMNIVCNLGIPGNTPDTALRLKTDWYLTNKKTNQWWSPVSFVEGFVIDRMFFGGQNLSSNVLSSFTDVDGFLTNFVTLGILASNFNVGQFYAPPRNPLFPFPVNEWFEVMVVMAGSPGGGGGIGQGTFIKTPESIANGFIDPRMASGDILPVDGEPAGWINTYPGVEDDPLTPEIEGLGRAMTQFGQLGPITGPLGLSPPLAAISLSGLQIGLGLDDITDPLFQPDDAFIDDFVLVGAVFVQPSPIPDFIIPYTDDMELYFPGVVDPQTDRIFTTSNAIISTSQNSTPLGNQSLAQITLNNDSIFRVEFGEHFPTFPLPAVGSAGTDGVPFTNDADGSEASLVVSAQVRIGVTTRTSRAIRIVDGAMTGNFVGTIILGATNPLDLHNASDGRIWIRQPNVGADGVWGAAPGFDKTKNGQDNLTQGNWWPASQWDTLNPPAGLEPSENDFNNQFTNIPTGAMADGSDGIAVVVNTFTDILIEVQPNPGQDEKNPYDEGLMRVTINGSVVPNPARADGLWLAGGFSASEVQSWSGNEPKGIGDTIHVDDVTLSGSLRTVPAGPAFTAPYMDSFELYTAGESIGGQGDTPFLELGSLADRPLSDNDRTLTLSTKPPSALAPGVTLVCRYMVDDVKLSSGLLNVGDTVVMNFSEMPLPFDTLLAQNIDCPGAVTAVNFQGPSIPFVLRPFNAALGTAENQPRVETGTWTLLTMQLGSSTTWFPELYDPIANPADITIFSYSTTLEPRWAGSGSASLIVSDPTGAGNGRVLQVKSLAGVDGTLIDNPDFFAASALMPQASSDPGSFSVPSALASLSVDIYIESLDVADNPVNVAPRSRMSLSFFGAGADAGRITTINFGGPNVNNITNLLAPPPFAFIIGDGMISYMVDSGIVSTDTKFVPTAVSVITGGLGLGPLLNTWFTLTLDVDSESNWTASIDEDRTGPLPPVAIATGIARDFGLPGIAGVVDTSNMDFIEVRQGRDLGSGGEPIPNNFRVRTLVNNAVVANPQTSTADVTAPINADKDLDYCFYQTSGAPEFQGSDANPPVRNARIAVEGNQLDVFDVERNLSGANDVIAVVNRAYDSTTNMVSGPLLFDPCPINIAPSPAFNRFDLFDGKTPSAGIMYTGRWTLLGQLGQAGINNPPPAGGLGRIDGPARTPPVSYNDFTVEPAGFPATLASRPIIVVQWGSDPADATLGVDPFGTVLPNSRWFFDNVNLRATVGPTPCADINPVGASAGKIDAADLASLLGQWGPNPGNAADFNGDGVVNAADLAILLGNWGPCP